jgi:ribonuclease HI
MTYKLYTDGACRGNPGDGACAWNLVKDDTSLFSTSIYVGHCTNNIAEYCAVLYGLVSLIPSDVRELIVTSDSELIVNQLTGRYQCNKPELNFYRVQILEIVKQHFKSVQFEHAPRTDRFIAECDRLCNERLDQVKKETS